MFHSQGRGTERKGTYKLWPGDVAKLMKCLTDMCEALASTPVPQKASVVVHTWNPSIREVEAGESDIQSSLAA